MIKHRQEPVRGNLNFSYPADVEPDISQINDHLDTVAKLTQDDIEWAYEQGASNIEEVVEMVSQSERGEMK